MIEQLSHLRTQREARQLSPLQLAYLGDSVYELYVRTHVLDSIDAPSGILHRRSTRWVNAAAQAKALMEILPKLTQEEGDIARWGRNARNNHVPKNMSASDYARATGLETLLGYLYITGQDERLTEIIQLIFSKKENP